MLAQDLEPSSGGFVQSLGALFLVASGFGVTLAGTPDSDNWGSYGRTYDQDHFSPLTDIDVDNVSHLGLAWWFDIPGIVLAESVPLAINGTLFFVTGYSVVRAVNGATGRLLWTYDPGVAKEAGRKLRLLWGVRGIASLNGRIYVGTHDGRLVALNAKTGKPVWSVVTTQPGDLRIISGPPLVFGGKVMIGHAFTEAPLYGEPGPPLRGYVTAYDAVTGKQLWRFFTVPGDPKKGFESKAMEMAAKTWSGDWWKHSGGGTVWNAMTYDPELNRVYIGTSNGFPMTAKVRDPVGGDNLFLASIVALDADSGTYVWHYQTNPAETWDYDATEDLELAHLVVAGTPRRVLMQASKNGFFYVIDRDAGKLISAEKFAKVTWAEEIDLSTGRPVETASARDESGQSRIWPSGDGAHGWPPMAFSPVTNLVYIPVLDSTGEIGACNSRGLDPSGNPCVGVDSLLAWDPLRQQAVWRVSLPGVRNAGVAATAGNLVFQGRSDGQFAAYAADSGNKLWSFDAETGIVGAPISYKVGARQYVSVMAGFGGGSSVVEPGKWKARTQSRRLLTFALDANARLPPPPPPYELTPIVDPGFKHSPAREKRGFASYTEHCPLCHGYGARAGGHAPDLRESAVILSAKAFAKIVKHGGLREQGMPQFQDLSDSEVSDIRQYLRARARKAATNQASEKRTE